MNLVVVTHAFPPMANARAIRWGEIARCWAAAGHAVTVVAACTPGAPAVEHWHGVAVVRVGLGVQARVREAARRGGVAAGLGWLYRQTWRRLYWPDAALPWIAGTRAAARAEVGTADALITVSPPFSGHVVGLGLRARLPVGGRWLADFGDPFSFLAEHPANNHALYGRLNVAAERRVFARADAIAVTHEGTRARYAALFPEAAGKIRVIPPLLPERTSATVALAFPCDALNLAYVGSFYAGIRAPDGLAAVISRLLERFPRWRDRLRLHLFGAVEAAAARFAGLPEGTLVIHGAVDHATAAAAMRAADVLVNVGNATAHQLPSKLVEYVATGRPVVSVACRDDDTSARFLADYPLACTLLPCREGVDEAAARLDAFLGTQGRARLAPAAVGALVAPHRAAALARRYLDPLMEGSPLADDADHAA